MKRIQVTVRSVGLGAMLLMVSGVTLGQENLGGSIPSASAARSTSAFPNIRLKFNDGTSVMVDEAWESEQGIWYRQSGMSHLVSRDRVKVIERNVISEKEQGIEASKTVMLVKEVPRARTTRCRG